MLAKWHLGGECVSFIPSDVMSIQGLWCLCSHIPRCSHFLHMCAREKCIMLATEMFPWGNLSGYPYNIWVTAAYLLHTKTIVSKDSWSENNLCLLIVAIPLHLNLPPVKGLQFGVSDQGVLPQQLDLWFLDELLLHLFGPIKVGIIILICF